MTKNGSHKINKWILTFSHPTKLYFFVSCTCWLCTSCNTPWIVLLSLSLGTRPASAALFVGRVWNPRTLRTKMESSTVKVRVAESWRVWSQSKVSLFRPRIAIVIYLAVCLTTPGNFILSFLNNFLKAKSYGNIAVAASTINIYILKLQISCECDNLSKLSSDLLTEHWPYLLGSLLYLHSLTH